VYQQRGGATYLSIFKWQVGQSVSLVERGQDLANKTRKVSTSFDRRKLSQ
jgi:hypothetical protein